MREELDRAFSGMVAGSGPNPLVAGLDGMYGALIMAMVFGVEVEYYPDNWPAARHQHLTSDQMRSFKKPHLMDTLIFRQLWNQMDLMEQCFGRIEGYLNWQGVLNTAYRLRGPEILADMLMDPGLAAHLFEIIAESMVEGMKLVYERQRRSGVVVQHATVSNCMVNMISQELYREQLLPWDKYIAGAFPAFGIHNCAWNVDPYIEEYASISNLGYVDMGIMSDLSRARRLCPYARRAVMYTPMDLRDKSPDEIRRDIVRIQQEIAPCDIVLADIDTDVSDEKVRLFARIVDEIRGGH